MNYLYKDLETFSYNSIDYGVYKYAERAEILLYPFAYNDEVPDIWDVTKDPMPDKLKRLLKIKNLPWVAHNSQFDRVNLEKCTGITHYPWIDTMVIAYQHGLPGALGTLCDLYNFPDALAKQKRGKQLIDLFCKPLGKNRKLDRATRLTHPQEWEEFKEYAIHDILSMRELHKRLPKWNCTAYEYKVWQLDQKINERGMKIDMEMIYCAIEALKKAIKENNKKLSDITKGVVTTGTQRDRILKFIKNNLDCDMPNLQASTVIEYIQDPAIPDEVKTILKLRQNGSKSSTAKYEAILNTVNDDERVRAHLQYAGAFRTMRWAGRNIQPQNLPKPAKDHTPEILFEAIEELKRGELRGDEVPFLCSSMLRNTIIADEGKKLIVPDYKSIEDRTRPWLAGDYKKINEYKKIDEGIGQDMYKCTYANTFGINPEDVTKYQRSLGKILALAFGYQGGVGAFIKFATSYNLNLQEIADKIEIPEPLYSQAEEWYYKSESDMDIDIFIAIDGIKRLWRENNPVTVQYWYDIENAAKSALKGYNSYVGNCIFDTKKNWLRIKLPSGRYICYAKSQLIDNKICYWHKDKMVDTYGGKLVENITQAVARDVLTYGMFQAEKHGYKLILTVHDELVAETPDTPEYTLEKLCKIVSILPDWAYGLPMPADGFEGYRYKKDD